MEFEEDIIGPLLSYGRITPSLVIRWSMLIVV